MSAGGCSYLGTHLENQPLPSSLLWLLAGVEYMLITGEGHHCLLHGSLHRATHLIAACFSQRQVSEREVCMTVTKTEVTIFLEPDIESGIPSLLQYSVHNQREGLHKCATTRSQGFTGDHFKGCLPYQIRKFRRLQTSS